MKKEKNCIKTFNENSRKFYIEVRKNLALKFVSFRIIFISIKYYEKFSPFQLSCQETEL